LASRLAGINYRRLTKRLKKFGFALQRQGRGCHEIWWRQSDGRTTVIPSHPGDMNPNVVKSILDDCGISVDDFLAAR